MRFVSPLTTRIHLKNGSDWIDVKQELTVGEDKKYRTAGFKRVGQGEGVHPEISIDFAQMALARVDAYLVDWSAKKDVSPEAIRTLAKEDFDEIDALIQAHIAKQDEEKKAPQVSPSVTSPSA